MSAITIYLYRKDSANLSIKNDYYKQNHKNFYI